MPLAQVEQFQEVFNTFGIAKLNLCRHRLGFGLNLVKSIADAGLIRI